MAVKSVPLHMYPEFYWCPIEPINPGKLIFAVYLPDIDVILQIDREIIQMNPVNAGGETYEIICRKMFLEKNTTDRQ